MAFLFGRLLFLGFLGGRRGVEEEDWVGWLNDFLFGFDCIGLLWFFV